MNEKDDVAILFEIIHYVVLIMRTIRMDYKNEFKSELIKLIKKL